MNTMDSRNTFLSKGIRKKVKNSQFVALEIYKVDSYIWLDLDKVLNEVYCSIRPVSADYDTRKELVKCLNAMAQDIYGNSKDNSPVLEAYGSFVMDMFSSQSDLDVSINFGNKTSEIPREEKLQILRSFAEKLRCLEGPGHVGNVVTIYGARVPIVKFVDKGTAIECDLSVENKDGILNSQIIHIISQIDDRFQKLCMLVKHWAKAHEVNSALNRTLNSVSITLLVAFHLQTQDPPILPPFSMLFKDGMDPPNVEKRTQKFINWGQRNQESLGRLFATFFIKFQSVEFLWRQGLCVSVLDGFWISKKWKKSVIGSISIEDFTDVSQNVARRVNGEGAQKIFSSMNRVVKDLFEFLDGKLTETHLKHKLFGQKAVVKPPLSMPPLNAYSHQPHEIENYRIGYIGFIGIAEEHGNKRVCLENSYKAVGGSGHGREEEERYENLRGEGGKRMRYEGNGHGREDERCNDFEEYNEIHRIGIHNDSYREVSLNGEAIGHNEPLDDSDDSSSDEKPMYVGLLRLL